MAGGKLSARQKMINLMYLVFIAMLAMNMSKEVLSAFGFMKEEITISIDNTAKKNLLSYDGLALKANDQPETWEDLNEKAKIIKRLSTEYYNYLADIKNKMQVDVEDKVNYESMDKTDFLDEYFFKGDGKTEKGQEFVDKINSYKENVISALGSDYKDLKERTEFRFNTTSGTKQDWLDKRYKGFPLIASLTNITHLQSNIKNTESDVLTAVLGGQLEASSKLTTNNYKGIVRLEKTAYFAGETVKGEVVLGRYDSNLVPIKVTLGKTDITKNVANGQVILNMPAGNVGNKKFKGEITFMQDGAPAVIPYESEYSVIAQPDSPVISADKMNVVYRGLDNPISISLPGVGDRDIKPSAPGLKKVGTGKYIMRPGAANTVQIKVTAKVGSKTITRSKEFRVKDIPSAMGSVRGQYGTVRMPKSGLANSPISAGLPDFMFDLKLQVNSFKIKVPGQLTIIVQGSRLNASAKKKLQKAKRGDIINIYDIKASIIGNTYKLKKVLPVSIELTN